MTEPDVITSFLEAPYAEISVLEDATAGAVGLPSGVIMRIAGTALIDGAVSQNDRVYTREFNDTCLAETLRFMSLGGVVSMFSRHGRAVQVGALATGLPTGRVTELSRHEDRVKYKADIMDTSEGRDVAVLLRTGAFKASSIRLRSGAQSKKVKLEGRSLDQLTYGIIKGIDLADEAGIVGAGVEEILEEAEVKALRVGDDDMAIDWTKVTLEEIKTGAPTLLQEYVASYLEANPPKAATDPEAAAAVAALTAERDALKAQVTEAQSALASALEAQTAALAPLQLDNALLVAAQIGVGREIYKQLKAKVTKVEEIQSVLEGVRAEALNTFIKAAAPKGGSSGSSTGAAHTEGDDGTEANEGSGGTEEFQDSVLRLSAHRGRSPK